MVIRAGYAPASGDSGSGTLSGHKFTTAETFELKDGLSAETIVFVAVDCTDVTQGAIDIVQDGLTVQTVLGGKSITRVNNPSSDLDIISRATGGLWDISTGVFDVQLGSVSTSPNSVTFNNSGTIMYVLHVQAGTNDLIKSWSLTTPYDVSSATALGTLTIGTTVANPTSIFMSPDNLRLYLTASTANVELQTWTFGTIGDITTLTQTNTLAWASDTTPQGIWISDDGINMYVGGNAGGDVYQFVLSTPWLLTTAVETQVKDVSGDILNPQGIQLKPDGSKIYISEGGAQDSIHEFTFGVAWDISTIAVTNELDVTANVTLAGGFFINPLATFLQVCDTTGNAIEQYDSSVAVAFSGTGIVSGG